MANEIEAVEQLKSLPLSEEPAVPPSIQQLIDSQNIKPVRDISVFAGLITDSEIDDFVSEIYETRRKS